MGQDVDMLNEKMGLKVIDVNGKDVKFCQFLRGSSCMEIEKGGDKKDERTKKIGMEHE